MKIDHIGYAVKRMDRAIAAFEKMGGGIVVEETIDDTDRNIQIVFVEKDGYRLELVSPLDKGRGSPVDQYLKDTPGTPYHVCYKSNDFDNEIEILKQQGFKVIIEPKPAIAFGGRRVAFLMSLGFGLMEIVEENSNETAHPGKGNVDRVDIQPENAGQNAGR